MQSSRIYFDTAADEQKTDQKLQGQLRARLDKATHVKKVACCVWTVQSGEPVCHGMPCYEKRQERTYKYCPLSPAKLELLRLYPELHVQSS